MSNSINTPVSSTKKRDLSSPEELAPKKNKIDSELSVVTNTDTDMATNITLDEVAIQSIAAALTDTVISRLSDSMHGMVETIVKGVIDGLSTRIGLLESENKTLKNNNEALSSRVQSLEAIVDSAEQYSRRNCLRFAGIDEKAGEDTDKQIVDICKDMDATITMADIDRSHRIGKPNANGKPRAIIVKFTSYRVRRQVFKKRTGLRNCGHTGVFVNEDLTRSRSELLFQARKLYKAELIQGCWSTDGTVLIKVFDTIRRIQTEADLDKYKHPMTVEK